MKVVGLDLSLTGSGVAAIYSRDTGETGVYVQEYGSKPTTADLAARGARLRKVATPVLNACQGANLVVIEDLFMGAGTGAQLDRAGLWWIIVNSLTANGLPVVAVTNNHLKMYAVGKGGGKGTDKDAVLAQVIRRYLTVDIKSNNTCDALVLAAMGARHLGFPVEGSLPDTHLRAMGAVKW